ncbi:plasmodesmata-located protein 3-like isoform X1 [Amaranthus tricolor]|uniref:plasmodesmata-located protein 3-like isoform X1 n=1 Tax=Amaranthus tricolor TaxID=29722 RepID=UPI002590365E|nr:plasmodesmata-located protein 3-like isoform X1 [Amaranthus tricolor]
MGTQHQILFIIFLSILLCSSSASTDYTALVYKGCADQNFPNPSDLYAQSLKTLFDSLISQSSNTNFSKLTTGESTQTPIFGLYQCRGDLNSVDCSKCVSEFPKMARKYCGSNSIAARIQLIGCYMRYEIVGFKQVSSTELLYKYCKKGEVNDQGFEGKRESVFQEVESGAVSGNGFYAASYESVVYVLGQCEGDLMGSECGDCIRTALERVKVECGDAIGGQVYLNQCYVSYTYYPNGVDQDNPSSSSGTKKGTAKTVAIVLGGTAAAGFVVVILLFTKSVFKKKPSKFHYGG